MITPDDIRNYQREPMPGGFKGLKSDEDIEDGIEILQRTDPMCCGGTDAFLDRRAPKKISSDEMVLFRATSALGTYALGPGMFGNTDSRLTFVSAHAVPSSSGTFLFLSRCHGDQRFNKAETDCAHVKEDVFPSLVALVKAHDLARSNGHHSNTHGLPENFGGDVYISYASGETISFSNNQCPILSMEAATAIVELFESAMKGERVPSPDLSGLRRIEFSEERGKGGYVKAVLTILPDGTGVNRKESCYDDVLEGSEHRVYTSEKTVDAETVESIRRTISGCGMLHWDGVPERKGSLKLSSKSMDFVFDDGTRVTARDGLELPYAISGGFFNIELEMTTKHRRGY